MADDIGYKPDDFGEMFDAFARGEKPKENRVPVFQSGRMVGTMPSGSTVASIRSTSGMYDVRPGDWTETANGLVAHPTIGPGDLWLVAGFSPLIEANEPDTLAVSHTKSLEGTGDADPS